MGRGALFRQLANTTADVDLAAEFWIAEEQWERVKDRTLGLCSGKVFNFLLTMVFATRRCMSGRGLAYVNSGGDVFPCSTCSGNNVLCAGNVMLGSFKDIWDGPDWEIRRITWDNFKDTCEGCPINEDKYFCASRCPGSSSVPCGWRPAATSGNLAYGIWSDRPVAARSSSACPAPIRRLPSRAWWWATS
jgi:radical SAM protein with 4Fe4S-binding SPASM domain